MTEQSPAAATTTNAAAADAPSGTPAQPATPAATATPANDATPAVVTDSATPEGQAAPAQPAVPEKYELAAPEGFTLEPETTAQFETVARELKLTNEQANQLVPLAAQLVQRNLAQQQAAHAKQVQQWLEESKADKEFGGERFDASVKEATQAVARFGTPQLKELLNQTGLGNHPEVVRLFQRIGKAIADDKFVNAPSGAGSKPDLASRLFKTST